MEYLELEGGSLSLSPLVWRQGVVDQFCEWMEQVTSKMVCHWEYFSFYVLTGSEMRLARMKVFSCCDFSFLWFVIKNTFFIVYKKKKEAECLLIYSKRKRKERLYLAIISVFFLRFNKCNKSCQLFNLEGIHITSSCSRVVSKYLVWKQCVPKLQRRAVTITQLSRKIQVCLCYLGCLQMKLL